MNTLIQSLLANFDKSDEETIRSRQLSGAGNIADIDNIFLQYYSSIGVNGKALSTAFKNQKSFSYNKYKPRSFACLLVPNTERTIQEGYLGQLDDIYYDIMYKIYNRIIAKAPNLTEDATKIFSFMGALPTPLVCEPPSSRIARKDLGLPEDTPNEYNKFLRFFIYKIFKENYYIPKNFVFKITSNGNPGIPEDVRIKGITLNSKKSYYKEQSFKIFKRAQISQANEYIGKGVLTQLLEGKISLKDIFLKYGFVGVYKDQHRKQPDIFSKVRWGSTKATWDAAGTGPTQLDRRYSIKQHYKQFPHLGRRYGEFEVSCVKNRFVFSMSHSANGILNILLNPFRKNYGDRYDKVFKCSDRETLENNINNWILEYNIDLSQYDLLVFDIQQYDNTFSRSMMRSYVEGIADFNTNVASLVAFVNGAPGGVMLPYDGLDIKSCRNKLFLTGNPFDLNSFNFGIAKSGTTEVTEKAKLPSLAFVLYHILNNFNNDDIDELLDWHNDKCIVANLGDNNMILYHKSLKRKIEGLTSSDIFKIEVSSTGSFGGLNIIKNNDSNKIEVHDSAVSSIIKVLTPERPLDDPMRSSYYLGCVERYDKAKMSRDIAIVVEAIDSVLYDVLRAPSQLDASIRILRKDDSRYEKENIYHLLNLYVNNYGSERISKFFLEIMESGGDKLFYTDLYEKLSNEEREIIDSFFFTTLNHEEYNNILEWGNLKTGGY